MKQPSNTKHEASVSGGLVKIAEHNEFSLCNITLCNTRTLLCDVVSCVRDSGSESCSVHVVI